jgi:hypothetical protein
MIESFERLIKDDSLNPRELTVQYSEDDSINPRELTVQYSENGDGKCLNTKCKLKRIV